MGSTTMFVLISGFFFHNTFYPTFSWGPFLRTKLVNVGVPFLTLTALYCAVFPLLLGQAPVVEFRRGVNGGFLDFALLYLQYAFTGRSMSSYWYVPFIVLIFAASPLFIRFIKLRLPLQLLVFAAALFVSVLVHRPENNDNPFHSALYFSAVYLLGILTS
jgi:hypothetical protein